MKEKTRVHPKCYNRKDYHETLTVQDGWLYNPELGLERTKLPRLVTIPNAMTKHCQQWGSYGAGRLYKWDCRGCRFYKDSLKRVNDERRQKEGRAKG